MHLPELRLSYCTLMPILRFRMIDSYPLGPLSREISFTPLSGDRFSGELQRIDLRLVPSLCLLLARLYSLTQGVRNKSLPIGPNLFMHRKGLAESDNQDTNKILSFHKSVIVEISKTAALLRSGHFSQFRRIYVGFKATNLLRDKKRTGNVRLPRRLG
jgi:hypothetical protein